ncbi:AzlD domain-containing protein [Haloferax namakaokahaiae]|uniref:AzlD domain-containing protein n=1 Tax=Haloferax namakaokahaiae TaxID=1748331 RepID=A0ABD5ZC98_9EURY
MPTDYNGTTIWGVILVAGALTFAIRGSFIYLFGRIDEVPPLAERALKYVPPAVFAALVAPELVAPTGTIDLALGNEQLVAGIVAAIVAWYTENVLATIGVGMAVLWLLRFVV